MKKMLPCVVAIGFLFLSSGVWAEDGESIFKSNRCGLCHKPDADFAGRPSLKTISQAYNGKDKQLDAFLKGESEPIIIPAKASTMKRHIQKTKALSEADRKQLVEYLLKH